jgi:hypothetical protein
MGPETLINFSNFRIYNRENKKEKIAQKVSITKKDMTTGDI